MKDVGSRFQELRKALGYTQKQMADVLGIDHAHISKIEKGKGRASDMLLSHICNEFLVSKTWLTAGEGQMFLQPEEIIKRNIIRLGDKPFIDALKNVLREQGLTVLDPEFDCIINFVIDLWMTEDEKLKAWAEVQFARSFPPDILEEVHNKRKDSKVSDISYRNQQRCQ